MAGKDPTPSSAASAALELSQTGRAGDGRLHRSWEDMLDDMWIEGVGHTAPEDAPMTPDFGDTQEYQQVRQPALTDLLLLAVRVP